MSAVLQLTFTKGKKMQQTQSQPESREKKDLPWYEGKQQYMMRDGSIQWLTDKEWREYREALRDN